MMLPVDVGRIGTRFCYLFFTAMSPCSKRTPKMRPNVSRPLSAACDGPITWAVTEEAHFANRN